MSYKAVMVGKQQDLLEDMYRGLSVLDSIISSTIVEDLQKHISFYKPVMLVACLSGDVEDMCSMFDQIQKDIMDNNLAVIVIGEKEELARHREHTTNQADMYLDKSMKKETLTEYIEVFMAEREQEQVVMQLLAEERAEKYKQDRRKHILVVDDDPNVLAMLQEQLKADYNVATAVNGGLALKFLTKKTVDLILLDYEMPVQSGPQVMTILRNNESTKDIPIVFLTGVKDTEKIKKVLELKPQGYLLKPIETTKLFEAIDKVINGE